MRRAWDEWYADAAAYYQEHGDLLIPRDYITAGGLRLGRWIERQRAIHNGKLSGSLTEGEEQLLENIGMVWRLEYRFPWENWMETCRSYRMKHGDLLVPSDYIDGDHHLGNWIRERRREYWKGELSQREINDLNALGMVWAVGFKRDWDAWYADASDYRKEHGDLLVPTAYETKEGFLLGVWISEQRITARGKKRGERLTPEQRSKLDALDMVWDIKDVRADAWEEMYRSVADYARKNGRLPVYPKGQCAANGRRMDYWIAAQRDYLTSGKHPSERVKRLADIGIYPHKKRVVKA